MAVALGFAEQLSWLPITKSGPSGESRKLPGSADYQLAGGRQQMKVTGVVKCCALRHHCEKSSNSPLSLADLNFWRFSQGRSAIKHSVAAHATLGASADSEESGQQETNADRPKVALLLEVEGVLADVHKFGHRMAFNKAFQELKLEASSWTPSIYAELLRQAGGNEEEMLANFFNKAGWPSTVALPERSSFLEQVLKLKRRILEQSVAEGSVPLRPGLEEFIDEAIAAGVPVAIITAYTKCGETVAWDLVQRLGVERASAITRVGEAEVEASAYGQVVLGKGASSGLEEVLANQIAEAVAAEKQRLAEEVARQLKVTVELDTGSGRMSRRGVAALRAAAEAVGVEASRCVVLAGSHSGLQAACAAAMPCVVVRSSITSRAEFPQARAAMEGFGPGALTVARLLRLLQQQQQQGPSPEKS